VKASQPHYAYNAATAAAIYLTHIGSGIKVRIHGIAPGVFPSETTAGDRDEKQTSHIDTEKYENRVPARRPGRGGRYGECYHLCCHESVSLWTAVV
jgi:hypothetical protein